MYTVIVILILLVCLFLAVAVLVQNSKGGGLASNFAAGNQAFGVRQAADILEKATWWFAAIIIVFSIAATAAISTSNRTQVDITKQIQQNVPANAAPTFPISGQGQPAAETPAEETPAQQ